MCHDLKLNVWYVTMTSICNTLSQKPVENKGTLMGHIYVYIIIFVVKFIASCPKMQSLNQKTSFVATNLYDTKAPLPPSPQAAPMPSTGCDLHLITHVADTMFSFKIISHILQYHAKTPSHTLPGLRWNPQYIPVWKPKLSNQLFSVSQGISMVIITCVSNC